MQILSRCRSHTKYKKNEVPVLDAKAVFASLKSQGRIADKSEKASAKPGVDYVHTKHSDGGFHEWYKSCWLPRVLGYEHDAHMEGGEQEPHTQFDMKTPVFQVFKTAQGARLPSPPKVPSMV